MTHPNYAKEKEALRAIIAIEKPDLVDVSFSSGQMSDYTHEELLAHIRRIEKLLPTDVVEASWELFAQEP